MKKKLLLRLSSAQFGMQEMREFLDTHPGDPDGIELYNKYKDKYNALKKEYEEKYGPLTLNGMNSDEWLSNPWPWDNDFDCEKDCDTK